MTLRRVLVELTMTEQRYRAVLAVRAGSGHGTANPARGHHGLQSLHTCFARRVKQEVIIAPIAQTERTLRNPGQQCQHYANFQAENYIKDDT